MFRLDKAWLESVGLGPLRADAANRFLAFVYEKLQLTVGTALAEQMSREQLDAFSEIVAQGDQKAALAFLETYFPHYREVVAECLAELEAEVRADAPAILAAEESETSDEG